MALGITLGIGLVVFQLFRQNERVFRDQNLVIEMQQTARVVASQIADEVRMAGEGVPVYASRFDSLAQEGAAVVLASSTNNRIDFRAGLSLVETSVTTPVPLDCTLGLSRTLTVADGSSFLNALGTTTPTGKFVYIWGPANNQTWTWVRAELTRINGNTLTLTPRQGGVSSVFTRAPTLTLEEAVSFYLSGTNVKRATAADMTNLASPAWSGGHQAIGCCPHRPAATPRRARRGAGPCAVPSAGTPAGGPAGPHHAGSAVHRESGCSYRGTDVRRAQRWVSTQPYTFISYYSPKSESPVKLIM